MVLFVIYVKKKQFYCQVCRKNILISAFCLHTQIHTGECADRTGGSSGGQNLRSTELSGGASAQTQLHGGDATAGTTSHTKTLLPLDFQMLDVLLDQNQETLTSLSRHPGLSHQYCTSI